VWGSDVTSIDTPFEAGLGFAVRMDKGDFIGRDALERPARLPDVSSDSSSTIPESSRLVRSRCASTGVSLDESRAPATATPWGTPLRTRTCLRATSTRAGASTSVIFGQVDRCSGGDEALFDPTNARVRS